MQGGPTAALGEADVGKVVPSVRGGPPCWQHRGCAVGPGGPLESRAHLCGLDPSAVPFPPGRAAGRESLRRVFCAPELPPRVPGPRARIPLLRLEDKPPGAPGCCAPSARLAGLSLRPALRSWSPSWGRKTSGGTGGRPVTPDFAPPHVQRPPAEEPSRHQTGG